MAVNQNSRRVRGVVYVEFLIVIIPLLILMFSLVQMALFLSAGILTHLAALKAARSAMVVIDDDHEKAKYPEDLYLVGNGASGVDAYRNLTPESRFHTIRLAARAPLLAVSPTLKSATAASIDGALNNVGGLQIGLELMNKGWTWYYVGLGFLNDDDAYVSTIRPDDHVRVRVVFLYPCFVPIGRAFACHKWDDLPKADRDLLNVNDKLKRTLLIYGGWRFVTLSAEAPIPRWDR